MSEINMSSESYKDHIQTIYENIGILNFEKEFRERISKIDPNIKNPCTINEDINHNKENFSKLKFQYLEQETKEKFLRAILGNPPVYVTQEEINRLDDDNQTVKASLKDLKRNVNKKVGDIDDLVRETTELCEELQDKKEEFDKLLIDFDLLQRELNEVSENQTEDSKEIIKIASDMKINIDSGDEEIIKSNARMKLDALESADIQIANDINLKKQLFENSTSYIGNLKSRIASLSKDAEKSTSKEDVSKSQLYAQWIKCIKEILSDIIEDKEEK